MPGTYGELIMTPVSIITVGRELEAITLRAVLEHFGSEVEVHRISSRDQFLEIMRGNLRTCEQMVITGDGKNGAFLLPDGSVLSAIDLDGIVHLPGKILLSTCCTTGNLDLAGTFLQGGCSSFIGPIDSVDRKSALMFAIHLMYYLARGIVLDDAMERSREHDTDCGLFRVFYL